MKNRNTLIDAIEIDLKAIGDVTEKIRQAVQGRADEEDMTALECKTLADYIQYLNRSLSMMQASLASDTRRFLDQLTTNSKGK